MDKARRSFTDQMEVGSKVNGMGKTFQPWGVHCHLLNFPDGLGSVKKNKRSDVTFGWFYSQMQAKVIYHGRISGKEYGFFQNPEYKGPIWM